MHRRVTDARGRVFVRHDYSRIVSLVPSWTESLFVLHAGDRIIAVTDYCTEPKPQVAHIRKIGGTKNPRIQEILSLHPDLVIANVEENRKADVVQFEDKGVPVFVTDARTVRDAIEELSALGQLLGVDDLTQIVDPIKEEYSTSIAYRNPHRRPSVFVAIWKNPLMTANDDTFMGNMIDLCGGDNIFRNRERLFPLAADLRLVEPRVNSGEFDARYPRVSLHEVIDHAPEVILLPDEPYAFTQEDVEEWRQHPQIPAVRSGNVYLLDGKVLTWYGVRMAESMKVLRKLLNGVQAEQV